LIVIQHNPVLHDVIDGEVAVRIQKTVVAPAMLEEDSEEEPEPDLEMQVRYITISVLGGCFVFTLFGACHLRSKAAYVLLFLFFPKPCNTLHFLGLTSVQSSEEPEPDLEMQVSATRYWRLRCYVATVVLHVVGEVAVKVSRLFMCLPRCGSLTAYALFSQLLTRLMALEEDSEEEPEPDREMQVRVSSADCCATQVVLHDVGEVAVKVCGASDGAAAQLLTPYVANCVLACCHTHVACTTVVLMLTVDAAAAAARSPPTE
jgi:hypothetical protein